MGLVGSARAVRAPSLGFAAAFALIVGVSVAVFSAGMATSLAQALALASDPATRGDIAPLDAGHPIVAAVFAFLGAAAGLPLLFCVVAIVLAVIAAARSRNRTVGVLRVLGFSAAQVRGLVAWELVPVVIVAIVAGVALGRRRGARSQQRARSGHLRRCDDVDNAGRGRADHGGHRGRLRRCDRPRRGDSHECRATKESWFQDQNGDGMTSQISCVDLVRIFSAQGIEVQALQGLNLEIEAGELTAIVGASGSGKSTLLTILSGLDSPTAGSAMVDGHDLLAMRGHERTQYRRETVGFVFQQTERNLLPFLSAAENISMALAVARSPRALRAARVDAMLDVLGLTSLRDRKPSELSGGQRQRVAIAVGLANAPRVLLADEPTGELDEQASVQILELLREINERLGVTVLIVTHDEAVSDHVRRTIQIRDGRTSTEVHRSVSTDDEGVQQAHRPRVRGSRPRRAVAAAAGVPDPAGAAQAGASGARDATTYRCIRRASTRAERDDAATTCP